MTYERSLLVITNEQNQLFDTLTETSAIAEYLSYTYRRLGLDEMDQNEIRDYYFWKNFADSNFMPNLALKQIFKQLVLRTPFPFRSLTKIIKQGFDRGFLNTTLEQQLQLINIQLEKYPYIAGSHFSIADILLWFPLKACVELDPKFKNLVPIQNYLSQIENRPAFKNAALKGQWSVDTFTTYWSSSN